MTTEKKRTRTTEIDVMTSEDVWDRFNDLAAAQGISRTKKVAQLIEACVNGAIVDPTEMEALLDETGKKRVEKRVALAVKQRLKNVDWKIEQRVMSAIVRRDEYMSRNELEVLADAERIRSMHEGLMSRAEYVALLKALHEDTRSHVSRDSFNRLTQLITELKGVLVKPEPLDSLPRSWEELAARRAEARKTRQAEGARP